VPHGPGQPLPRMAEIPSEVCRFPSAYGRAGLARSGRDVGAGEADPFEGEVLRAIALVFLDRNLALEDELLQLGDQKLAVEAQR